MDWHYLKDNKTFTFQSYIYTCMNFSQTTTSENMVVSQSEKYKYRINRVTGSHKYGYNRVVKSQVHCHFGKWLPLCLFVAYPISSVDSGRPGNEAVFFFPIQSVLFWVIVYHLQYIVSWPVTIAVDYLFRFHVICTIQDSFRRLRTTIWAACVTIYGVWGGERRVLNPQHPKPSFCRHGLLQPACKINLRKWKV